MGAGRALRQVLASRLRRTPVCTAVAAGLVAAALPAAISAAASQSSANLVGNPDAEASPGVSCNDNSGTAPPAGWQVTGALTVLTNDCTPPLQGVVGSRYFAGGPTHATSTAAQDVDLARYAAAIDGGATQATLSALLGGWQDQEDYATVSATFLDQAGRPLGRLTVGPVTAAERGNATVLLPRSKSAIVPRGSRRARVVLSAVYRTGAVYNDGYADSISLVLRPGPRGTTAPATTVPRGKLFRFAWAAKGQLSSRTSGGASVGASIRGSGTFAIDGAGKILKIGGKLVFTRRLEIISDRWVVTPVGGRYHEDPKPTAELKVTVDSLDTAVCDANPSGTLELFDGEGKRPDHVILRACRMRVDFEKVSRYPMHGASTVVIAELR